MTGTKPILVACLLLMATPALAQPGGSNGQVQYNNSGAFGGLTDPQLTARTQQFINVRAHGALGNSNGTAGNGNDDTTAIQNAFNAAGQTVNGATYKKIYFPCGTYRITATVTGNAADTPYQVFGDGNCSQIFLDAGSGTTALSFTSPAPVCGGNNSLPPCVSIDRLYFTTPTTPTNSVAIAFISNSASVVSNSTFVAYGKALTYTNSYSPRVIGNTFLGMRGSALECVDVSCNNAVIWRNQFFGNGIVNTDLAIKIGNSAANCESAPNNISIHGNDLSYNYGAILFRGACAVSIDSNYFEQNTTQWIYANAGVNQAFNVRGNWISGNGAASSITIDGFTGLTFDSNTFYNQTINFGTSTQVGYAGYNAVRGTSTLQQFCSAAQSCSYGQNGKMDMWGFGTVTATPTAFTYPVACQTNITSAVITSLSNGVNMYITALTNTQVTVAATATPTTVSWRVTCG